MTDYRSDRTFSRIRYVEYEHTILLYSEDLSKLFGLEWNPHIHWFIQDNPSSIDEDGTTTVICADDRTGTVLYMQTFEERHDVTNEVDNNFYAKIVDYVTNVLGYDLGELLIDIRTPMDPTDRIAGALLQIIWTTFETNLDDQ